MPWGETFFLLYLSGKDRSSPHDKELAEYQRLSLLPLRHKQFLKRPLRERRQVSFAHAQRRMQFSTITTGIDMIQHQRARLMRLR